MKQYLLTLIILTFAVAQLFGQSDSGTVYKELETSKFYYVGITSKQKNGKSIYKVNGKKVSESTYEKYDSSWDDMKNCCPCILQMFDENEILIREAVSCTDCGVGSVKEFYINGQVKFSGQYKENPTGNWDDISERGYCNVPDGQWNYYNKKGILLYSEFWNNGEFIKQVPVQNKTEIWKVELTLNGEPVNQTTLLPNQLKDLKITPKFKNSTTKNVNLSIGFQASVLGQKYLYTFLSLDEFKTFDLQDLLSKNGFKAQDSIIYSFMVLNNDKNIATFNLNILADLPMAIVSENKSIDSDTMVDTIKTIAYNTDFYLVNSIDTTKKVKLVPKIPYKLTYFEKNTDTLIRQKDITLSGFIVNLTPSIVTYDIHYESVLLSMKNGIETWTENEYGGFDFSSNDNLRNIPLKNLGYIYYRSPSRYFFRNFGIATSFLSAFTSLIVAPLVSINYRNGGFNKDRYFAIAGSGLIGLTVSIPVLIFSKPKYFMMKNQYSKQGKDIWYIQSQTNQ
jgi:hypothetical protein